MNKKLFLLLTLLLFGTVSFAQSTNYLEQIAPMALKNREFVLYFQPICKFDQNKICGAEVLTRWIRKGEVISPGKFIPIFEENGFIKEFDAYVVDNALNYLQDWQNEGLQIGFLSINISAIELDNMEFIEYLKSLLIKYDIIPDKVIIEITETKEIKNQKTAKEFMLALKNLGIKVALDDFGDGYATLDKLETFRYDTIKLSKKLLDNFQNKESKKELRKTIKMLREYSVPIIAEGIENIQEAKFLRKQKVAFAQGYLYYKPMPETDFKKLLSNKLPKYCYFK